MNHSDKGLLQGTGTESPMQDCPDFRINTRGVISQEFRKRGILTFKQAAAFIQKLPYGRNTNINDPISVFTDNCGTCSTKHAILKQLADENNFEDLILMCGIFRMNSQNTPAVSSALEKHKLQFIPEAHVYLKFKNRVLDFTNPASMKASFRDDLIEEIGILPHQIATYKVTFHKQYLKKWIENDLNCKLSVTDLWTIREQCIQALCKQPHS